MLLDALGTLLALEPPAPRLRAELRGRFGIEVDAPAAQRAITAEIAYYRAHLCEGRDEGRLLALRRRCARVLADSLARELAGPLPGERAMTDVLLASFRFAPFSEAIPALGQLRRTGLRLVVVSNWDVSLHAVMAAVGLAKAVDAILTSAEVGAGKPAPVIFRRALELAGSDPAEAWHVGDSIEEDVAGARAAGIEPVLICRDGRERPSGVTTVASLSELPALLGLADTPG